MSRYYEPGMEGLIKDASMFHDMLAIHLPQLSTHLDMYKLDALMYMTPWFLSMFTHLPNWELVLLIYDMFFVEGYFPHHGFSHPLPLCGLIHESDNHRTSALFRFALAILEGCAEDLLSRQGLERILPFLLHLPVDKIDTEAVTRSASIRPNVVSVTLTPGLPVLQGLRRWMLTS